MKKCNKWTAAFLVPLLLFNGCGNNISGNQNNYTSAGSDASKDASSVSDIAVDTSNMFSDRDYEVGFDEGEGVLIALTGDSAQCSSNAVQITGSTVTITDEGTYILSGELTDGMIIVNAENTDKLQLVLNGVQITSSTSAALYILQADKVFVTTAANTENALINGGEFAALDDNNIDAVIFSKDDLTLNGQGTLIIESPAGHGIVSKDDLVISCGNYKISSASHGLSGKDSVRAAGGIFDITSGKDGIHAENTDDTALGFVYILNGTYNISSEGDGISASNYLLIENGDFTVTAGGGSVNGSKSSSDSYGQFAGGGRNNFGGRGEPNQSAGNQSTDDSTSMKGIKAAAALRVNDGTFQINTADDALHSNASLTVTGGNFQIAAGDDALHADDTLTVSGGIINISESYEGLEGLHVIVSGGEISLVASDDGLNAAGGVDSSGTGGRDNGMFGGRGGSVSSDGTIVISGGTLYIQASGDGIDANGTLEITGGRITVCGPTQGDTATLDYDVSGTISGGTFIGTGASGMAQTFTDSEQGVIAVSVGNQSAGTQIVLKDSSGNTILTHEPELSFAVVILSSPEMVKGQTYTISVGSQSGEFEAS